MSDSGLSRREVLSGLLAGAVLSGCDENEVLDTSDTGFDTVDTAVDTAQDRWNMLVNAVLDEDVDTLMGMTEEEYANLKADTELAEVVPDCHHILYTAKWWGYFKKQDERAGRNFVLPPKVRTNLHWKASKIEDPLEGTYGIC